MGFFAKKTEGLCVPKAFFAATTWAIKTGKPVFIADFKGHWQAVGYKKDRLVFLKTKGVFVWAGKRELKRPVVKLWTLKGAMTHFLKHNPAATQAEPASRLGADLVAGLESTTVGNITIRVDPDVWRVTTRKVD